MVYRFNKAQKTCEVHFIPDLKVWVFVTLCDPEVINYFGIDIPRAGLPSG
jgi:hypothetical protein